MSTPRARNILAQSLLVVAVAGLATWIAGNLQQNLAERSISGGFGFFSDTAGFAIGESEIAYCPTDTISQALIVGLINTLKVSALAIIAATLLGVLLGVASLANNALLRGFARAYVEAVRNVPLLVQLLFLYAFVLNLLPPVEHALEPVPGIILSNRGVAIPGFDLHAFAFDWPRIGRFNIEGGAQLSSELLTLVAGLSIYTAAYIGEIVRGGIESVPFGQTEAAGALGLRPAQTMRRVVLPQALPAILPPLTSWYLNTVKNSSLAIAVGYPDLLSVVDTVISQTGQAVEGVLIIIVVYLSVNLALSFLVNWYNATVTRRGLAAPSGPRPRPSASVRELLASPRRSLVSIALAVLAGYALWSVLDWLLLSATLAGDASDCRRSAGACWPFIGANYRTILFGTYPQEEQWRAALCIAAFAAALGLSFWRRLWGAPLMAVWVGAIVLGFFLLDGGVLGLATVETDRWSGLPLTLLLAALAVGAALPLAVLLALARRSRMPVLRTAAVGFIEFMRGVPLVGLLFMAAILFPLFMPPALEIESYWRVQVALILFTAAYMAEAVRAGLQAVSQGQREAAIALGLSYRQTMQHVVLPQALRVSAPGLVNTSISEVKNTTLVLIVGMFDVLQTTRLALVDVEWRPFFVEAYAFTAALFFGLCFAISQLSRRFERSFAVGTHRKARLANGKETA